MATGWRRGRCRDALEHPDAFRARARLRGAWTATITGGRPVLAAARSTQALVAEVLAWARQMPLFATHLTGECLKLPDKTPIHFFCEDVLACQLF